MRFMIMSRPHEHGSRRASGRERLTEMGIQREMVKAGVMLAGGLAPDVARRAVKFSGANAR